MILFTDTNEIVEIGLSKMNIIKYYLITKIIKPML
jgi:hypothetical protein